MPPSPLNPRTTVLLLCDVQERFRSAIYGFEAMVGSIAKVMKVAKLLEIPIIATEQNPKALGRTISELDLSALPPALNLGTFDKTKFSMVIEPIEKIVQERKFESAIVMGIESHVCVLQTTLDLLGRGITPYLPADAISSCNKQEIPIAIERLRGAGAVISTTESLLFQLMVMLGTLVPTTGDAAYPAFRSFAAIIKEEKAATTTALEVLVGGQDAKR